MNAKLKKFFVVMVSVLTFGLVTPTFSYDLDHSDVEKGKKPNAFEEDNIANSGYLESYKNETPLETLIKQSEQVSYFKFGDRITPVIKDEFQTVIFPKIEEVMTKLVEELGENQVKYLQISEQPGKGKSEKMFHIYDSQTGEDLIRFHVRRDHPPGDGYWFNFHYHTFVDQFEAHHDLGQIYWSTDTPPNWMSSSKKEILH
ncbi:YpjP family protein [Bacillus carboniphilus]|uniref:YpjP family protein n=1 Tax=Bacillus carboniphilus TaxID=86663 RepID=A0ABP3GNV9_9BACI